MITLIIDGHMVGIIKRQIFNHLTLKELGETLTELSKEYILAYETVRNVTLAGFDLYVAIVTKR